MARIFKIQGMGVFPAGSRKGKRSVCPCETRRKAEVLWATQGRDARRQEKDMGNPNLLENKRCLVNIWSVSWQSQ